MIYKGSTQIKDVYYGGRRIAKVYYGSRLVYIRWRGDPLPIIIRARLATIRGMLNPYVADGNTALIHDVIKLLFAAPDMSCVTGENAVMMKYIVMRALCRAAAGIPINIKTLVNFSPITVYSNVFSADASRFRSTNTIINLKPSLGLPSTIDASRFQSTNTIINLKPSLGLPSTIDASLANLHVRLANTRARFVLSACEVLYSKIDIDFGLGSVMGTRCAEVSRAKGTLNLRSLVIRQNSSIGRGFSGRIHLDICAIDTTLYVNAKDTDRACIDAGCAIRAKVSPELSTWLYPIEDGDALIIRQAYLTTQTDTILEVE